MGNGGPASESSRGIAGALADFARARWRTVLVDFGVVTAYLLVLVAAFDWVGWPRWSFYALVVGGVVVYSLVTDWRE